MKPIKVATMLLITLLLSGCLGVPNNIQPVKNFDVDRYVGKWYEIARMDHSFERGLSQVTAEYRKRNDGGITVINRGFSDEDQTWDQAEGKAYFVEDDSTGYLKVAFFWPFYAAYVVYELDQENYQYAFVTGPKKSYVWFLSRTPQVSPELKQRFIQQAQTLGFDTRALIWVDQSQAQ